MIEIRQLEKKFKEFGFGPLDLTIPEGSHFVLLGPSGSGKSLLLEMLAGFVSQDKGTIHFEGKPIEKQPACHRPFSFVFQKPALFPHLTVFENLAFPLRLRKQSKTDIRKRIETLADRFSLHPLLESMPARLSGGEAQRVSLARAIAVEPKLLLLDEPLSSLDVPLRNDLRKYLYDLNNQGLTMIQVTHDFEEAIRFADQAAVVFNGQIVQIGKPDLMFRQPAHSFVAQMTGNRNFFKAKLLAQDAGEMRRAIVGNTMLLLYSDSIKEEGILVVDAESVILQKSVTKSSAQNTFSGIISRMTPLMRGMDVEVDIGIPLIAHITKTSAIALQLKEGDDIFLSFKASAVRFLDL